MKSNQHNSLAAAAGFFFLRSINSPDGFLISLAAVAAAPETVAAVAAAAGFGGCCCSSAAAGFGCTTICGRESGNATTGEVNSTEVAEEAEQQHSPPTASRPKTALGLEPFVIPLAPRRPLTTVATLALSVPGGGGGAGIIADAAATDPTGVNEELCCCRWLP